MPKKYEAIKGKFIQEGMGEAEAKKRAAKIYNKQRKPGQKPVTRKKHGTKKRGSRKR